MLSLPGSESTVVVQNGQASLCVIIFMATNPSAKEIRKQKFLNYSRLIILSNPFSKKKKKTDILISSTFKNI